MFKNVASQKLIVFAFDSTTNAPKTGDAANITAYVSKDYGSVTVLTDTSATEMDSTNAKGYYVFDLTQGETNADTLLFSAKSSTSNIVVIGVPATVFTLPATGILAPATAGRTLVVDASGLADANVQHWRSEALPVTSQTGVPKVDIAYMEGSAFTSHGTGKMPADVLQFGSINGTFASGIPEINVTRWVGGIVPTPNVTGVPLIDAKYLLGTIFATPNTAGLMDVNVKQAGGTTWGSGAITAASIASAALTAAKFATDAIDSNAIAASAVTEIQSGLSTLTQAQITGGSYALNSSSFAWNSALDFSTTQKASVTAAVWDIDATTHQTAGTFGQTLGDNAGSGSVFSSALGAEGILDTVYNGILGVLNVNLAYVAGSTAQAELARCVWQDATGSHFTTAGSIGKGLFTSGVVPGVSGGLFIAGSNAATTLAALTISGATTFTGAITGSNASNSINLGTDSIGSTQLAASAVSEIQSGLSTLDAAGVRTAVGLASANLDTQLSGVPAAVWASGSRTLTAGTNIQLPANALALITQIGPARTLPGQGTPTATPRLDEAIDYLYKLATNPMDVDKDTGFQQYYNRAGSTVDHKRTVSDDGTTFSMGALATGP